MHTCEHVFLHVHCCVADRVPNLSLWYTSLLGDATYLCIGIYALCEWMCAHMQFGRLVRKHAG
jgi:hypothetical protein